MSGDISLFGDDEPDKQAEEPEPGPLPIAKWQIDLLRKALDARGLTTMSERQTAIETATGRAIESLRALTHDEAFRVLTQLGESSSPTVSTGSAWDQRDEDTWIDRL